jgi:hypothetical protein
MSARFLIGSALASLLAATCSGVRAEEPFAASESNFDLSPLTFNGLLAQATDGSDVAQTDPSVVAAELAGPSQEALAKAAQNPIASMISIPIQWNATPGTQWAPNALDPDAKSNRTLNVVNIQPVFPFKLSDDWTMVTRTIIPFLGLPFGEVGEIGMTPLGEPYVEEWDQYQKGGIGDINPTAFFVPTLKGNFTFGFGPTVSAPTGEKPLGSGKWSAGPAAVGVYTKGPWVVGGLINNLWSFAGDDDRADVNKMLIQPFINYNLPKGWYLSFSPIITADWENDDQGWTVPVGGGIGRVFKLGKQPINASLHAYYNAIKPEIGGEEIMGDWTIRTQIQFLIPTVAKK